MRKIYRFTVFFLLLYSCHNKVIDKPSASTLAGFDTTKQGTAGDACGHAYVFGPQKNQPLKDFVICDHLPILGSKVRNEMVQAARAALKQGGEGWLAFDTRPFFSEKAIADLYQRMPKVDSCRFLGPNTDSHLSAHDTAQLEFFVKYMKDVLAEAFGCDMLTQLAEVRRQNKHTASGLRVTEWHVDQGQYALLLTLMGSSTEILSNTPHMTNTWVEPYRHPRWDDINKRTDITRVPTLCSLVITASESNQGPVPTVHRTPILHENRLLLVVRLAQRLKILK